MGKLAEYFDESTETSALPKSVKWVRVLLFLVAGVTAVALILVFVRRRTSRRYFLRSGPPASEPRASLT